MPWARTQSQPAASHQRDFRYRLRSGIIMGAVCGAANARRRKQRADALAFIQPLLGEACENDRKFEEAWSKLRAKLQILEEL